MCTLYAYKVCIIVNTLLQQAYVYSIERYLEPTLSHACMARVSGTQTGDVY